MTRVSPRRWPSAHVWLAPVVLVLAACGGKAAAADAAADAATPPVDTQAQLMEKGTGQLYQTNDPFGAAATFREVLAKNPTHYGATFQLARALDRTAANAEARILWEKVAQMSEASRDTTTLATARARLAAPDTASQEAMMALGLKLLYRDNNPGAAVTEFQKVLERNKKHYGATFQLARALDRAGKPEEAKEQWVAVLGMATAFKDPSTADTARARLARGS